MHAAPRAIAGAPRGTQVLVVYGENDPGLNELERAGRSRGGPPAPCSGESVIGVRDQLFRHAVSISLRTNARPDSCRSTPVSLHEQICRMLEAEFHQLLRLQQTTRSQSTRA